MASGIAMKKKSTVIQYTVCVLSAIMLMMFASFGNAFTYFGLIISIVYFIYLNSGRLKLKDIPKLILTLLLFQNFAIGIGAHLGGNTSLSLSFVTQIPTLMVLVTYVYLLFKMHIRPLDILYFVFVALCSVFLFTGDGVLTAKITYFRNFLIFYMAFSIGNICLKNRQDIDEFLNYFIKLSIMAFIFGTIGMILGKSFYQAMGVLEVYSAKQYSAYRNGLPGNFQTIFLGQWVNRFASLYYDPVNFSYFMALSTLIAYVQKKWKWFIVFAICELFTFGKGGMLILGLTMICIIAQSLFKRFNAKVIRTLVIIGALSGVIGLVYIIQNKFADDFGTYNHFYGMITGIEAVKQNPMGHGLGTAGNLIKTAALNRQEISETGLINLTYQIGIIGALLFSLIFLSTAKGAFQRYRTSKNKLCLLCTYLPIVLLIVSLYQENTYAPQCIVPYMLIIGASHNYN